MSLLSQVLAGRQAKVPRRIFKIEPTVAARAELRLRFASPASTGANPLVFIVIVAVWRGVAHCHLESQGRGQRGLHRRRRRVIVGRLRFDAASDAVMALDQLMNAVWKGARD